MKTLNVLLIACAALMFDCSSVDVTTDYDKDVNFARYKTFAWMATNASREDSGQPTLMNSALTRKRIRAAIEREFAAKGLTLKPKGPDMYITFHSAVKDKVDVERYGYRYGRWGQVWAVRTDLYRYKEGAIVVDLIDATTRDLVWRGIAKDIIDSDDTPDEIVNESVQALFKEYPPKK